MPANTAISFHRSGDREAARYVSADAVYEEALEHGRWIGLYWSASGQVQRENVAAGLPGTGLAAAARCTPLSWRSTANRCTTAGNGSARTAPRRESRARSRRWSSCATRYARSPSA